jgi:protein-tyrosine-phosphatase/predicted ATP-grasp superfamily ATP-dependent carboligase
VELVEHYQQPVFGMQSRSYNPVLILGAAPRISVAIARSLHRIGVPVDVGFFLDGETPLSSNAIRASHRLPHNDPQLIHALCDLIKNKNYDMLIPTSDTSLALIAKHYHLLKKLLLYPGCPPPAIVDRVLNKNETLAAAERCGIKTPFSCLVSQPEDLESLAGKIQFPVAVKPAERRAHTFKVVYFQNAPELVAFVAANRHGPLLVQEYCPGAGVGIEMLMHQGIALATFQHRRLKEAPATGGVAVMAVAEEVEPALAQAAFDLLRAIEWEGPAMVEFRYDHKTGGVALMEVNGRFWGTSSLPILAGLDFPRYAWEIVHGIHPEIPDSYQVGTRWRWTAGYIDRLHGVLTGPSSKVGPAISRWRALAESPFDFSPAIEDSLWSWSDVKPALSELADTLRRWSVADAKWLVRKLVPRRLMQDRGVYHRLGPKAGPIYAKLRATDTMGIALENRRTVPPGARSFVFVCHGNIMRSPMAERMFKRALVEHGQEDIEVCSAGMHALSGREAHPRALLVGQEMGLSLDHHRAQLMTEELVQKADAIFAMDFQNKAELLARFPEAERKIFMLSAYADGSQRYREIDDPYFGGEEEVRRCYALLQTCVHNLVKSLWPVEQLAAYGAAGIR